MNETPTQRAHRLMKEIEDAKRTNYSKGDVKTLLNSIAQMADTTSSETVPSDEGCRAPAKVKEIRRGDVFIAKMVGGKVRPWITLRVDDGAVTAVAMSPGDYAPNMQKSQCRYWPGNWIGNTVSQFSVSDATAEMTRPYTNLPHIREVETVIAEQMGMALPGPKSISDLRYRKGAA